MRPYWYAARFINVDSEKGTRDFTRPRRHDKKLGGVDGIIADILLEPRRGTP